MKTDKIFYEIFKEFPSIFFELLGQPEIDANAYQFSAPEIKQLSFRLDGVFAPLVNKSSAPVYFVEVQFYKDEKFYDRLFASIFLYLSQYQPTCQDWYAIVIYTNRRQASTLPPRYSWVAQGHLRPIYLDELGASESLGVGIVKLVIASRQAAKESARQLADKAREQLTDPARQEKVLQFLQTIVLSKFPNLSRQEIETMLNVSLLKGTKVYEEIYQEGEQKGEKKGEMNTKLNLVPKLLTKGMSIQEVAELLNLDEETVKEALP
jgi:predicted transposase/invertase (TIGR01784 family)